MIVYSMVERLSHDNGHTPIAWSNNDIMAANKCIGNMCMCRWMHTFQQWQQHHMCHPWTCQVATRVCAAETCVVNNGNNVACNQHKRLYQWCRYFNKRIVCTLHNIWMHFTSCHFIPCLVMSTHFTLFLFFISFHFIHIRPCGLL